MADDQLMTTEENNLRARIAFLENAIANGEHARPFWTQDDLDMALKLVSEKQAQRLLEKGRGIFVSSHEILGIVKEEFDELAQTVQDGNEIQLEMELIDIAVACLLGIASIRNGNMDWL